MPIFGQKILLMSIWKSRELCSRKKREEKRAQRKKETMPWQTAPALVIISGAFTVTGGLLMGIQYAAYGKVCKMFNLCVIYECGSAAQRGGL